MHVGMACQHENVLYVDIQMFAYTHVKYCHVNMFDVTCEHCCLSNVDIQYRGRQYLKHACADIRIIMRNQHFVDLDMHIWDTNIHVARS